MCGNVTQSSESSLLSTAAGVCVDGVESEDPEDDADWLPSLEASMLAVGDDICGMMEW